MTPRSGQQASDARTASADAQPIPALRKAALVIVSLDEALAQSLVGYLDRADVDALNLELTRIDGIDPDQQKAALEEFVALGAERVRFVFDNVAHLRAAIIRAAFREEDTQRWALALAGASRRARTAVLDALAPAASESLRHALTAIGPFRLDDVDAAQHQIAEVLRRLIDDDARARAGNSLRTAPTRSQRVTADLA